MNHGMIEHLEPRRLLSDASVISAPTINAAGTILTPGAAVAIPSLNQVLTTSDVQTILAQAISQSVHSRSPNEVAAVVDREGNVLGLLASAGAVNAGIAPQAILEAVLRARTAALFESTGEAFTSRTARFIIQNHFPPGIADSPGGPLYGVEFSDLFGSDLLPASITPAISGDPGGIPLYIKSVPVGAIGVAGDGHDVAAEAELVPVTQDKILSLDNHNYNANPKAKVYHGVEETDRDEAIALAGAQGFMPPGSIRANNIFVGGLALPFAAEGPARGRPVQTFQQLVGAASPQAFEYTAVTSTNIIPTPSGSSSIIPGTPEMENYTVPAVAGKFAAVPGLIRERGSIAEGHTITDSQEPGVLTASAAVIANSSASGLTLNDVTTIINQAVDQATVTRAGIRKPNGINAEVHVAVVDLNGNVLGDFRMNDGTNFSNDIAVQKARTAAFFSDDTHAFSARAIGFMSQKYFPAGINGGVTGPLYTLQDHLNEPFTPTTLPLQLKPTPPGLPNGITIFPGGFPLYKNGKLVGSVGVSGDGVDQDDLVSYTGAAGFQAPASIRSDNLSAPDVTNFLISKIQQIEQTTPLGYDAVGQATKSFAKALAKTRLPYAKFPRNPHV
jgi:uncharacterized protein GlcG (DUF336 family)